MESNNHNRRQFLKRFSAAVAVGAGTSTLLSACGGGETAETAAPAAPEPAAAEAAATGCMDVSDLTEQEVAMRNQLTYVDQTANAEQRCDNCALYLAAEAGSSCGGCNLLKGPIAPGGYCISWAAAQT